MNQIIFSKYNYEIEKKDVKQKKNILGMFKIQFALSIFIILSCTVYYLYNINATKRKEQLSKQLLSTYNINMLYAEEENYSTTLDNIKNVDPFVIGLIEIKKLDIIYPILSDVNDDYLKIATCRFYGPMPNEIGNLCIAAHNYHDTRFFSQINKLNVGDSINIYDLQGNIIEYIVNDKFTVSAEDSGILTQETNGNRKITLLTCNNRGTNRLVVTAIATI